MKTKEIAGKPQRTTYKYRDALMQLRRDLDRSGTLFAGMTLADRDIAIGAYLKSSIEMAVAFLEKEE